MRSARLDGMDVWLTIVEGKPSPREEVVYDIEPFRAAVRKGAWKLVWQATLPSQVELFNLAEDPAEKTNLAGGNPEKVAELQRRIEAGARRAALKDRPTSTACRARRSVDPGCPRATSG